MPRALASALAVIALLALGCGTRSESRTGTDARRYHAQVSRISNEFGRAGQAFRDSVSPRTTPRQAAVALQKFQSRVRGAAASLKRLTPPPQVATPHRQLTSAFVDIARAAQPSIDAGRRGDAAALRSALERFSRQLSGPLGARARTAATEIDRRLATR